MKGFVKKLINGKEAFYFELFIRTKSGRKGISRYLGTSLPDLKTLGETLYEYYDDFSKIIIEETGQEVKEYFKYTSVDEIEKQRFFYQALSHPLNKEEFRRFQTEFMILFTLNSSRAEGSHMLEKDIEESVRKNKAKSSEQREALKAIRAVQWALSKEFTWSTISIRKLHHMLFHDSEPEVAGKYKSSDNVVGGVLTGGITSTTPHDQVKDAMKKWVENVKSKRGRVYPPILALESHLQFEAIHPFHDGNGRIGRILLNRLLVENSFMPVIFFEGNHKAYCNGIAAAREGRKDKYIKLFVKQLKKTREVFDKTKNAKGFYSKRKGLAISWDFSKERVSLKFKDVG